MLLAHDNDDIQVQVICSQFLRKARATWWVCVGKVLRSKNASPCVVVAVVAKFHKAMVQAMLLYGSETWVLSPTTLTHFEGFYICSACYRMG